MKLLLVYEGVHEGHGALKTLVERILGISVETEEIRAAQHSERRLQGKGGRLYKKAVALAREAEIRGLDGVVFLVDFDTERDGPDRIRQMQEAQTQTSVSPRILKAFGVPVITFDSWMIADEGAMSRVLKHTVDRTSAPEANRDAKSTSREIVADGMSLREFYDAVARLIDLELLRDRCPKGFSPFLERLSSWNSMR